MSGAVFTKEELVQACERAKQRWLEEFSPRKRGSSREISAIFDAGMSVLVCLHDAILDNPEDEPAISEDDDFASLAAADPEISA